MSRRVSVQARRDYMRDFDTKDLKPSKESKLARWLPTSPVKQLDVRGWPFESKRSSMAKAFSACEHVMAMSRHAHNGITAGEWIMAYAHGVYIWWLDREPKDAFDGRRVMMVTEAIKLIKEQCPDD